MNNPTCDEWYQLGMEMGHISSNWRKIYHEMVSLFGHSNKFPKLLDNIISKKLMQLKSDLDDQINGAFPLAITQLPGYDVNLVGVFYSLNNGICYSSPKNYKKYPKKISLAQHDEIHLHIDRTVAYLNKVDDILPSKLILKQFLNILNKVKYTLDHNIDFFDDET